MPEVESKNDLRQEGSSLVWTIDEQVAEAVGAEPGITPKIDYDEGIVTLSLDGRE